MSGINEIKDKLKTSMNEHKSKISIDELYENQTVGKMDNQEGRKMANHPPKQTKKKEVEKLDVHTVGRESEEKLKQTEVQRDRKQDLLIKQNFTFIAPSEKPQRVQTYKMTFNLTEDIYKAFNDLYTHRLLQERKTEKSEMIYEAVQWLIKMKEAEEN